MVRIYHGYKRKNEHTVIPGIIRWVHDECDKYHVEYYRMVRSKVNITGDFDDMGKRKLTEFYHYQQKSNKQ